MKKYILVLLGIFALGVMALGDTLKVQGPAPTGGWDGAVFYDTRDRQLAVGVMHPITVFHDFIRKGLTVNLSGFAGFEAASQGAVAAAMFMVPFNVSGDGKFSAQVGLGISGRLGGPISVGPAASVSIRF